MKTVHTGRYSETGKKLTELRNTHQRLTDQFLAGSGVLNAQERALLSMVLDAGISFNKIAELRGEHPGTVCRRFKRLLGRLKTAQLAAILTRSGRFSPLEVSILTEVYIRRTPRMIIAAKLDISRYCIRQTLRRIKDLRPKTQNHSLKIAGR